jgi:carboxylesterase type B
MDTRRRRCPLLVGAVVAAVCGAAAASPSLEVKTAQGRVAGESLAGDVRIFRGIPYAAPPNGELRWRIPQPPAAWKGVRDATHFGARCVQIGGNAPVPGRSAAGAGLPMSEDCLFLNVWTAARGPRERRPVAVWLHGGSFIIGTGALYDGAALARRGVVVVTINYRLGAFGMFAHPALTAESADHVSGNYAFYDALEALRWVKTNIAAFGGDPGRITVMGQSGGGRFIQSLRTSPCAAGLFQRAIIESAPIRILPMRRLQDAEHDGAAAAETAAAPSLEALRALSAQRVLEEFPVGQPIIDGHCILQDPLRALETGSSHDVDLLVGSNADEGTFPYLRAQEYGIGFKTAEEFASHVRGRFEEDAPAFLAIYPGQHATEFDPAQREAFRDEAAWLARFSAATHDARSARGRTFLYFFSHRPPPPSSGPDRRATHGAEISYVFSMPVASWTDEDRRVADVVSGYWANFVSRGDPNGPGLPRWPQFTARTIEARMNLGPMTPEPGLDARRLALFDALYRRIMGGAQRSGE